MNLEKLNALKNSLTELLLKMIVKKIWKIYFFKIVELYS